MEPLLTPTKSWARIIRALQIAGASIIFLTLAAVAARLGYIAYQSAATSARLSRARQAFPAESVFALKSAVTPEQIEQAVDPDGVVLRLKNGDWIAIRCGRFQSAGDCAVAHDTEGAWFQSSRSFGGALGHYRFWQQTRARARASADPVWSERDFLSLGMNRQLDGIEQSDDLAKARAKLAELGFTKFQP